LPPGRRRIADPTAKAFSVRYVFGHGNDDAWSCELELREDPSGVWLDPPSPEELPDWTRLDYEPCEHCPLTSADRVSCPIAANLAGLIEKFKNHISYEETTVAVHVPERTYLHERLPVQRGLFSLFGLVMATSGCPHMNFLRPLARFHLPFASPTETLIRVVSMYFLRQYFRAKRGDQASFEFSELERQYRAIHEVNVGIVKRIRTVQRGGDADLNGVIVLDSLAAILSTQFARDLDELEPLFSD